MKSLLLFFVNRYRGINNRFWNYYHNLQIKCYINKNYPPHFYDKCLLNINKEGNLIVGKSMVIRSGLYI